jgi:PQQ-dependent catabolism-associated CXXCW motif protein
MTRRIAGPRLGCLIGILAFAVAAASAQDATAPEPDAYRTQDYRAPTPATLKGARVITTGEAAAIWRDGSAVFVDVLPQAPRPAGLPPGTIWRDKPRLDIPGSIWLPDTGYGELASVTEDYFRKGLEHAAGADRSKMLVFYCLKDCWMSWNAAKRALAMGYANVAWFPEGSDGWQEAGLPQAEAQPAAGRPGLNPATVGSPAPAQTGVAR